MEVRKDRRYDARQLRIASNLYSFDNTARKLEEMPVRRRNDARVRMAPHETKSKARKLSKGYVVFMTMAMLVTSAVLIMYVRLQSDITNSIKHISALESELNDLRLTNDEEYSRIESSVNLEEVKRVAIDELGMTYAKEGQVIDYSSEDSDYVRQVAEIPE